MRSTWWLSLGLCASACGGGGGGDGVDTLPKRGERASDPTIVSATATCSGELNFKGLVVVMDATDPMPSNLATCAGMFDGATALGSFSQNRCFVEIARDCALGMEYLVDITVSNKTGGVTTASVKVRPAS